MSVMGGIGGDWRQYTDAEGRICVEWNLQRKEPTTPPPRPCRLCGQPKENWQMATPKTLNICFPCAHHKGRSFHYLDYGWADGSVIGLASTIIKKLESSNGR